MQGNPEALVRLGMARISRNTGTAQAVAGNHGAAINYFETAAKQALQAILVDNHEADLPEDLEVLAERVTALGIEVPPQIRDASGPEVDPARNAAEAAIELATGLIEPAAA